MCDRCHEVERCKPPCAARLDRTVAGLSVGGGMGAASSTNFNCVCHPGQLYHPADLD